MGGVQGLRRMILGQVEGRFRGKMTGLDIAGWHQGQIGWYHRVRDQCSDAIEMFCGLASASMAGMLVIVRMGCETAHLQPNEPRPPGEDRRKNSRIISTEMTQMGSLQGIEGLFPYTHQSTERHTYNEPVRSGKKKHGTNSEITSKVKSSQFISILVPLPFS